MRYKSKHNIIFSLLNNFYWSAIFLHLLTFFSKKTLQCQDLLMVSALETPHQSTFELPVRPLKINYPNSMNRKLCTQQIKKLLNNLTVKKKEFIFEMSTLSLQANGKWIHHDSYIPITLRICLRTQCKPCF
jgi:hypothetical protein